MSAFTSTLLRSNCAPFRGLLARNLSLSSQPTSGSFLRPSSVLAVSKCDKVSTSQEVHAKAEKEMLAYWEKNMGKRPWSPHLTIYTPPLVMRTSFLHRATGIAMAVVWASAGCGAFFYTGHYDAMLEFVNSYQFGPAILYSTKCILAYPLVYHYTNGMRHLAWDYAIGFDMKTTNTTGRTVLVLSVLLTLALASLKS